MIENDDVWVAKIAGGPSGLPLSGMMVIISTQTGQPQAILQDNGYLTQLRTAIAGLIFAKYLAPKSINAIGVLGTGEQARMQVDNKSQCIDHGEICQAHEQKLITDNDLIELGKIIADPSLGRTDENQITISDLTGVAIQDIQIAKAIVDY